MSAPPSIDAYDAQMLDFSSDPDVPMNIPGGAEFFAEGLMDHDGHLVTSAYSEHASVEVDMEEYVGDNAEYEMADETAEYQRSHELLDIEVYDASHAPSPLVRPQPLQPSVDESITSERQVTTSQSYSEHATLPELQGELESEARSAPHGPAAADNSHVEPSTSGEAASLEAAALEPSHPSDASSEGLLPASESHEQLGDSVQTESQLLERPAPVGADVEEKYLGPSVTKGHAVDIKVIQHEGVERPIAESALPAEDADDTSLAAVQDEDAPDQAPTMAEEATDPHHISDGVYIDPPPAVLLSVANDPELGFALFNSPDVEGEPTAESLGSQKVYSLLLEGRPTLYYEPLSSVFEALRQDEGLLSRVPHSFEGELVLDAYDLQLAVSEDNVHSREISLHDLNILHDGSDFAGSLRLVLRAVVPRFIIRYYSLQEQVQRLHVSVETGAGEHHEEHHEHDTVEEQTLSREEEVAKRSSVHVVTASEVLPTAEAEESAEGPAPTPEPTEEAPQEDYEPETSAAQEPAAKYHEVVEEVTGALEDENGYEGTNAGGEDEPAKPDRLDADLVHDVAAEDTDAPATVIGLESELGGEQTEYLDYVQPEEYDERYGEELPERAGGGSPVQYSEPHYEEGEQDSSAAIDEAQTVLPDPGEDEEDHSAPTPTPACAILESASGELTPVNTSELTPLKQENSALSKEKLVTSESKNEVEHVRTSGNHESNTAQTRIFSEIEESDSNFIKMLEREADAEFDQSFNVGQSGQESSVGPAFQHDETWDEWDDEDAEGDDEEDWIDPDAESNESSITLSSKASSKRNFDEVDPTDEFYVEDSQNSPGSKRPRVK